MKPSQAADIVGYLQAMFPDSALEPASVQGFTAEVAILVDGEVAMEAARMIVRNSPIRRFPLIAEIRQTYRSVADRLASSRAETLGLPEPAPGPRELPPEARELLARLTGSVEMPAERKLTTLPATIEGKCDDCDGEGERVVYGTRAVCRRCALSRLGAAAKIEAERLEVEQEAEARASARSSSPADAE